MLRVMMTILSHAGAKKRTEGVQILHFYGSFSNDIIAVKGLKFFGSGEEVGGSEYSFACFANCQEYPLP